MAHSDLIGSLVKGLEILKLVSNSENGLKVNEVAEAMGLKQPTCYNLVRTIVSCGFMEKRGNRLVLGEELLQLLRRHSSNKFVVEAEKAMMSLYQKLPKTTIIFAVPGSQGMVQTHRIAFDRPGVIQHLDSHPMHLYASGVGLIFLAFVTDEVPLLAANERWPFAEFGSHLWKSRAKLNAYLEDVRKKNLAVVPFDQDMLYRVSSGVFNSHGKLVACIGASVPIRAGQTVDAKRVNAELLSAAKHLSEMLE